MAPTAEQKRTERDAQELGECIDGLMDSVRLVATAPTVQDRRRAEKLRAKAADLVARSFHILLREEIERAVCIIEARIAEAAIQAQG